MERSTLGPIAAAVAVVLAPGVARAGDGYRGQVVVADVATELTLGMCISERHGGDPCRVGLVGYFLAAPLVHVAHGQEGRGLESIGLRVGTPVVAAVIGYGLDHGGEDHHALGIGLGIIGGMLAAQVLDAALLTGPADDDHGFLAPRVVSLGGSF